MDRQELDDKIRDLMATEPDAKRVAQKVLADLSAADQRDILALILPAHVSSVMTSMHRTPQRPPDQPRRGRTPAVFTSRDGRKFASAKRRDVADWELLTGTSLAAPGGGRKHFGEFTTDEVVWLVGQREAQAKALLKRADQYQQIADAMALAGVDQVRDLDRDLLVQIMSENASEKVE